MSISAPSPPTKNTSQEQGRNKTTVSPLSSYPKITKKQILFAYWYLDNICEYLFIKTETAMLSPHFVLLMRTPIVMPRPASSFLNISTISVRCSMVVPTSRDAGRLRRSGYTGPIVAHPQSPARVLRTHQSGILPRPHYGVHNVRLTFARPSPILR